MELIEEYDIGDMVVCDWCNADFTAEPSSLETGGFLFGSDGICPRCEDRARGYIEKFNEHHMIKAEAKPKETFKAFILRIRNGNNKVKFYA